jgi:hypothetical protein
MIIFAGRRWPIILGRKGKTVRLAYALSDLFAVVPEQVSCPDYYSLCK